MHLFIKDMVCARCRMAVETVLNGLNIPYEKVEMGRADLAVDLSALQYQAVREGLRKFELELIDSNKMIIVEKIKTRIREMVYDSSREPLLKYSVMLSERLNYDYTYLSNVFSEVMGSTIERFYITLRIRRVKEMMIYDGKNLKEISHALNFSSAAHLCLQFKKITGKRPSEFKRLYNKAEVSIDDWE